MTTSKTPALDGLDKRAHAVAKATERVEALAAEARQSRRSLDRVVGPLRDYYAGVEAGTIEPDADREGLLLAAVAEAQARVAPQITLNTRADLGGSAKVELVDPEVEGKLRGARARLKDAEREYKHYLRSRFDDLLVELSAQGTDLADKYALLARHARRADRQWYALRDRWRPLIEVSGLDWGDLPRSPFAELSELDEIPALAPRQLETGEPLGAPKRPRARKSAG